MSEVKRYEVIADKYGDGTVEPSDAGSVVFYEDYAALKEQFDFKQNLTEQVVALQKQCDALAAENLALKTGVTYFACGSEYGFDLFREKQAAIDVCLEEIDLHREGYLDGDGWDDSVGKTAWGIVIQSAQGRDAQGIHESEKGHTYQTCNYRLENEVKTPATEAYLNSVRAEGADKVAEYHFVRIDALKEVSRQGHLFHKAAYSDAVNVANLFRASKDGD